jgi:hypothetical protein
MDITFVKLMIEYELLVRQYESLKKESDDISERLKNGEVSSRLIQRMINVTLEVDRVNKLVTDHKRKWDNYQIAKNNVNDIQDSMTGKAN